MHTDTLIEQETQANGKLRLFSVYLDFAASVRARWVSNMIIKSVRPRWEASADMWALDFFQTSQPTKGMMLQGAVDAEVLIVALSSLDRREPRLVEWLNALADQKSELPVSGLFIGLLGDEDHQAGELGWTVNHFISCAQRMGMDFIWHWMGREAMNDTTWLTDNVEKFLSRKQSQFNMVWLQDIATDIKRLPAAV